MDLNIETVFLVVISIFFGGIVLGSLSMTIILYKKQRWRVTNPLYLIIMTITIVLSVFAYGEEDLGISFPYNWILALGAISIVNLLLLAVTKPGDDQDLGQGVKNAFKIAQKCPHCFSSLPSFFSSKCPRCTADL